MAAAAAKGKCGGLGQLLRKLERRTASAMLRKGRNWLALRLSQFLPASRVPCRLRHRLALPARVSFRSPQTTKGSRFMKTNIAIAAFALAALSVSVAAQSSMDHSKMGKVRVLARDRAR